jgi:hypothetical protein
MTCPLAGTDCPAVENYELAPGCRCPEPTAKEKGGSVTGNDRDFRRPGLKVFNPFKELPPLEE